MSSNNTAAPNAGNRATTKSVDVRYEYHHFVQEQRYFTDAEGEGKVLIDLFQTDGTFVDQTLMREDKDIEEWTASAVATHISGIDHHPVDSPHRWTPGERVRRLLVKEKVYEEMLYAASHEDAEKWLYIVGEGILPWDASVYKEVLDAEIEGRPPTEVLEGALGNQLDLLLTPEEIECVSRAQSVHESAYS